MDANGSNWAGIVPVVYISGACFGVNVLFRNFYLLVVLHVSKKACISQRKCTYIQSGKNKSKSCSCSHFLFSVS